VLRPLPQVYFLKPSLVDTYAAREHVKPRVEPSPTLILVTQTAMGAAPCWSRLEPQLGESLHLRVCLEGHVRKPLLSACHWPQKSSVPGLEHTDSFLPATDRISPLCQYWNTLTAVPSHIHKNRTRRIETWNFESWDDASRPMNVWFRCVHITMSCLLIMLHFCRNGPSCCVCFNQREMRE
jgi:hypothetical protein